MKFSEADIGAVLAAIGRTGGLAITAPVIGELGVSARARLIFVIGVGFAVGMCRPGIPIGDAPLVAVVELAVGLVTGLVASFVMARVAVAGQLMGLSLGLGFATQYDIHAGESAGTLRTLVVSVASLAFLAVGGLEAVVKSVAAAPAELGQLAQLGPALVRAATEAFAHGLALAAPIVLAAFAGNVGLAVMNRAAPAVNVFSISLAAILILGGCVLLASAAHLVGGTLDTARTAVDALLGA